MSGWMHMSERVEAYLAARRALGYALHVEGEELRRFAAFAESRGHQGPITKELALAWAHATRTGSALYRARRLEVVRGLARYCVVFESDTEIPAPRLLGPAHRRVTPHLYTEQEIDQLLAAAASLPPRTGLRPATIRTFLGLLAATGLRVCEALHLARADADLVNGVLTIRETKFRKSRYVPLHPTSTAALAEYARLRDQKLPLTPSTAFFVADTGAPLAYRQVLHAFQRLRRQLGWQRGTGRHPRMYDLRHTFACRRLLSWYEEGTDVNWALPLLSTYLGHRKVTDTYWYLTGVPALMAVAGKRFEQLATDQEDHHA
ncbi:MAG: tyrosine-type recombinase/integrase [Planctomycetota bacterium]